MSEEKQQNQDEMQEFINKYENEIQALRFYGDQIQFNSTLYQGVEIILKKLQAIEEKLSKIEDGLSKKSE